MSTSRATKEILQKLETLVSRLNSHIATHYNMNEKKRLLEKVRQYANNCKERIRKTDTNLEQFQFKTLSLCISHFNNLLIYLQLEREKSKLSANNTTDYLNQSLEDICKKLLDPTTIPTLNNDIKELIRINVEQAFKNIKALVAKDSFKKFAQLEMTAYQDVFHNHSPIQRKNNSAHSLVHTSPFEEIQNEYLLEVKEAIQTLPIANEIHNGYLKQLEKEIQELSLPDFQKDHDKYIAIQKTLTGFEHHPQILKHFFLKQAQLISQLIDLKKAIIENIKELDVYLDNLSPSDNSRSSSGPTPLEAGLFNANETKINAILAKFSPIIIKEIREDSLKIQDIDKLIFKLKSFVYSPFNTQKTLTTEFATKILEDKVQIQKHEQYLESRQQLYLTIKKRLNREIRAAEGNLDDIITLSQPEKIDTTLFNRYPSHPSDIEKIKLVQQELDLLEKSFAEAKSAAQAKIEKYLSTDNDALYSSARIAKQFVDEIKDNHDNKLNELNGIYTHIIKLNTFRYNLVAKEDALYKIFLSKIEVEKALLVLNKDDEGQLILNAISTHLDSVNEHLAILKKNEYLGAEQIAREINQIILFYKKIDDEIIKLDFDNRKIAAKTNKLAELKNDKSSEALTQESISTTDKTDSGTDTPLEFKPHRNPPKEYLFKDEEVIRINSSKEIPKTLLPRKLTFLEKHGGYITGSLTLLGGVALLALGILILNPFLLGGGVAAIIGGTGQIIYNAVINKNQPSNVNPVPQQAADLITVDEDATHANPEKADNKYKPSSAVTIIHRSASASHTFGSAHSPGFFPSAQNSVQDKSANSQPKQRIVKNAMIKTATLNH